MCPNVFGYGTKLVHSPKINLRDQLVKSTAVHAGIFHGILTQHYGLEVRCLNYKYTLEFKAEIEFKC